MSRSLSVIVCTILSFGTYFILSELYLSDLTRWMNQYTAHTGISYLLAYLIVSLPIVLGASIINEFKRCQTTLGLNRSIAKGIVFPLICTLPMFIGFALCFSYNKELTMDQVLITGVAAAFFEEFIFRGFLFGQLFRFTKLGFIPAVLIGACLFASMHLYQSHDTGILIGIFLTTFMGAVLFAWLFAEWNYNLWISIFLHFFMNLSWMLFAVSENAFGGAYANVFRILTITLAIVLTLVYKRKKGIPLIINRETIWIKHHRTTELKID
jgi:membrane protease YdiL (CAAX protease family)